MKRKISTHSPVFSEPEFADRYAKKHVKMTRKFGEEYSDKLGERGFSGGRILDAGCGFGETLLTLAREFPQNECVGIDLSDPLLKIARANSESVDATDLVAFVKADVQEIPYPDDYFKVVLNLNMVHLVDEPVLMLNELERVLAPDGFLFIADIRRSWIGYLEKEFKSGLTSKEAMGLIKQSKLRQGRLKSGFLWWRYEA